MKPQDIAFFIVFFVILIFRRPQLFFGAGLLCWIIAIPLFAKWTFFTAERLTWYGAGYILAYLLSFFWRRDAIQ